MEPSYMRFVVDRNVVMLRTTVWPWFKLYNELKQFYVLMVPCIVDLY